MPESITPEELKRRKALKEAQREPMQEPSISETTGASEGVQDSEGRRPGIGKREVGREIKKAGRRYVGRSGGGIKGELGRQVSDFGGRMEYGEEGRPLKEKVPEAVERGGMLTRWVGAGAKRGAQAGAKTAELGGKALKTVGKGMKDAGMFVSQQGQLLAQSGQTMMQTGLGLSSTFVGALIGVPMIAGGALLTALGYAMMAVGKILELLGAGLIAAGNAMAAIANALRAAQKAAAAVEKTGKGIENIGNIMYGLCSFCTCSFLCGCGSLSLLWFIITVLVATCYAMPYMCAGTGALAALAALGSAIGLK